MRPVSNRHWAGWHGCSPAVPDWESRRCRSQQPSRTGTTSDRSEPSTPGGGNAAKRSTLRSVAIAGRVERRGADSGSAPGISDPGRVGSHRVSRQQAVIERSASLGSHVRAPAGRGQVQPTGRAQASVARTSSCIGLVGPSNAARSRWGCCRGLFGVTKLGSTGQYDIQLSPGERVAPRFLQAPPRDDALVPGLHLHQAVAEVMPSPGLSKGLSRSSCRTYPACPKRTGSAYPLPRQA